MTPHQEIEPLSLSHPQYLVSLHNLDDRNGTLKLNEALSSQGNQSPDKSLIWTTVADWAGNGSCTYFAFLIRNKNIPLIQAIIAHIQDWEQLGECVEKFFPDILNWVSEHVDTPDLFDILKPLLEKILEQKPLLLVYRKAFQNLPLGTAIGHENVSMIRFLLDAFQQTYPSLRNSCPTQPCFTVMFKNLTQPWRNRWLASESATDKQMEIRRLLHRYGALLFWSEDSFTSSNLNTELCRLFPGLNNISPFGNPTTFREAVLNTSPAIIHDHRYWEACFHEFMLLEKEYTKQYKYAKQMLRALSTEHFAEEYAKELREKEEFLRRVIAFLQRTEVTAQAIEDQHRTLGLNPIRITAESLTPEIPPITWPGQWFSEYSPNIRDRTAMINACLCIASITAYYFLAVHTVNLENRNVHQYRELLDEYPNCMFNENGLERSKRCALSSIGCDCNENPQPWCNDFLNLYNECYLTFVQATLSMTIGMICGGVYLLLVLLNSLSNKVLPTTQLVYFLASIPGRLIQWLIGKYEASTNLDQKKEIASVLNELMQIATKTFGAEHPFSWEKKEITRILSKNNGDVSMPDLIECIHIVRKWMQKYKDYEWILDDWIVSEASQKILDTPPAAPLLHAAPAPMIPGRSRGSSAMTTPLLDDVDLGGAEQGIPGATLAGRPSRHCSIM